MLCVLLAAGVVHAGPPLFATPDQADLIRAARALQNGSEQEAFETYLKAARYGNKEAQKNVALMYMKGMGVEKDWARAYAWLRLAATHQDPRITEARDQVFAALREDEREVGQDYYREIDAEYGDVPALARREDWVARQKSEVGGARTGAGGALRVQVADSTGYSWELTGQEYFEVLDGYVSELKQYLAEPETGEFQVVDDPR